MEDVSDFVARMVAEVNLHGVAVDGLQGAHDREVGLADARYLRPLQRALRTGIGAYVRHIRDQNGLAAKSVPGSWEKLWRTSQGDRRTSSTFTPAHVRNVENGRTYPEHRLREWCTGFGGPTRAQWNTIENLDLALSAAIRRASRRKATTTRGVSGGVDPLLGFTVGCTTVNWIPLDTSTDSGDSQVAAADGSGVNSTYLPYESVDAFLEADNPVSLPPAFESALRSVEGEQTRRRMRRQHHYHNSETVSLLRVLPTYSDSDERKSIVLGFAPSTYYRHLSTNGLLSTSDSGAPSELKAAIRELWPSEAALNPATHPWLSQTFGIVCIVHLPDAGGQTGYFVLEQRSTNVACRPGVLNVSVNEGVLLRSDSHVNEDGTLTVSVGATAIRGAREELGVALSDRCSVEFYTLGVDLDHYQFNAIGLIRLPRVGVDDLMASWQKAKDGKNEAARLMCIPATPDAIRGLRRLSPPQQWSPGLFVSLFHALRRLGATDDEIAWALDGPVARADE